MTNSSWTLHQRNIAGVLKWRTVSELQTMLDEDISFMAEHAMQPMTDEESRWFQACGWQIPVLRELLNDKRSTVRVF